MPSRQLFDRLTNHLDTDATLCADHADAIVEAYRQYPLESAEPDPVGWAAPDSRRWPGVILLAGLGLLASFLLAFLTLNLVKLTDPVEATPSGVITRSITTQTPGNEARQDVTQTVTVVPTRTFQSPMTTTGAPLPPAAPTNPLGPPATMTNPLEPPATMTNPLEPPATMTNPLEPPATMTNPLEPPATMTNPLEPPIGAGSPEE